MDRNGPCYGFGYNANIKNPVLSMNEHEVVFTIGTHVVMMHLLSKEMVYFPVKPAGSKSSSGVLGHIQGIEMCPKRSYLAVARINCAGNELKKCTASIVVYSLKGKKIELLHTVSHKRMTRANLLSFSDDSKLLACVCDSELWTIMVFDWKRERLMAHVDTRMAITTLRFHIFDKSTISTSGVEHIKLWRMCDEQINFLPIALNGPGNKSIGMVDHIWVADDVLVALAIDPRDIYVMEHGNVVQTIKTEHCKCTCIQVIDNGFLAGADKGHILIFQKDPNVELGNNKMRAFMASQCDIYVLTMKLTLKDHEDLIYFSRQLHESYIMCCTKEAFARFRIPTIVDSKADYTLEYFGKQILPKTIDEICISWKINIMTIASTCHNGSCISAWNLNSMECMFTENMNTPVQAIDLHPSGIQLLVLHMAKARLYWILADELQFLQEIQLASTSGYQHCTACKYSPGGNLFAIACIKNIRVYNTFGNGSSDASSSLVGVFNGISNAIECLRWANDTVLFSADSSGTMLVWHTETISEGSVAKMQAFAGYRFTSVDITAENAMVLFLEKNVEVLSGTLLGKSAMEPTSKFVVYKDVCKTFICQQMDTDKFNYKEFPFVNDLVCCLKYAASGYVYAGTETGKLYTIQFSDKSSSLDVGCANILGFNDLFAGPLSYIEFCNKQSQIIAGSKDGSIILLLLSKTLSSPSNKDSSYSIAASFNASSVCMYSTTSILKLEQKYNDMCCQSEEVKEKYEHCVNVIKSLENKYEKERIVSMEGFLAQKSSMEVAYQKGLEAEKSTAASLHENFKHNIDERTSAMQLMYQAQLVASEKKLREAVSCNEDLSNAIEDLKFALEERGKSAEYKYQRKSEKSILSLNKTIELLKGEKNRAIVEYDTIMAQMEEEHFTEINLLKKKLAALEASQKPTIRDCSNDLSAARCDITLLRQNVQLVDTALQEKEKILKKVQSRNQTLESDKKHLLDELQVMKSACVANENQVSSLNEILQDKDKRILNLERKCNVANHQLQALQDSYAPKQHEIDVLRQNVDEVTEENFRTVQSANELDAKLEDLRKQNAKLSQEFKHSKLETKKLKAIIDEFRADLDALVVGKEIREDYVHQLNSGYSHEIDNSVVQENIGRGAGGIYAVDLKTLRIQLRNLYTTHVLSKNGEISNIYESVGQDRTIISDLSKQNFKMAKAIKSLDHRIKNTKNDTAEVMHRSMSQNSNLVSTINELRKENHALQLKIASTTKITNEVSSHRENNNAPSGAYQSRNSKAKKARPHSAHISSFAKRKLDGVKKSRALFDTKQDEFDAPFVSKLAIASPEKEAFIARSVLRPKTASVARRRSLLRSE